MNNTCFYIELLLIDLKRISTFSEAIFHPSLSKFANFANDFNNVPGYKSAFWIKILREDEELINKGVFRRACVSTPYSWL